MIRAHAHRSEEGFTLVEVVSVMTVLSIVGMIGFQVVLSAMGVYTRAAPQMEANYAAQHAARRLRRDLRALAATDTITTFTETALTFDDLGGDTIVYELDGDALKRNGDILADGLSSFTFGYWSADGTEAVDAADLHLVQVEMVASSGEQSHVLRTAVFPRALTSLPQASEEEEQPADPAPSGLIAHWDCDEPSGSTAADNVGANDGTLRNGSSFGASGPASGGTAITYDGSNDYLEAPHDDVYLLAEGTIQLWFRADDTSGNQTLFSKDSTNYDTGGHVNMQIEGDDVEVRFQSTSTSYEVKVANVVSANTWHHVAFTFGPDGMRLYFDGALGDTDAYTGGMGTTSGGAGNYEPITFGASQRKSGDLSATPLQYYFDGRIDEVAIYDNALDASEISVLHAAGGAI